QHFVELAVGVDREGDIARVDLLRVTDHSRDPACFEKLADGFGLDLRLSLPFTQWKSVRLQHLRHQFVELEKRVRWIVAHAFLEVSVLALPRVLVEPRLLHAYIVPSVSGCETRK